MANGDDEEDIFFDTPVKKRKRTSSVKKQKAESTDEEDLGGFAGQTATRFKVEDRDEEGNLLPQDLDDDEYVTHSLWLIFTCSISLLGTPILIGVTESTFRPLYDFCSA